jgi:hypothetical protein
VKEIPIAFRTFARLNFPGTGKQPPQPQLLLADIHRLSGTHPVRIAVAPAGKPATAGSVTP